MSSGWTMRDDVSGETLSSTIDYEVEATDGGIGEVTAESILVDASYIVVDTGFWILDKKRLIPARAISGIDHDEKKVFLSMNKDEIREAPEYVPESKIDVDGEYRDAHEIYYRPWFGI